MILACTWSHFGCDDEHATPAGLLKHSNFNDVADVVRACFQAEFSLDRGTCARIVTEDRGGKGDVVAPSNVLAVPRYS